MTYPIDPTTGLPHLATDIDPATGAPFGRGTLTVAPPFPADPRDATIAAQDAEITALKAENTALRNSGAGYAGQVRADDGQVQAARKAELIAQGADEADAAEQAAYEARTRADQANAKPNVTV